MPDAYEAHQRGLSGPADRGFAITPHASNPLAFVTRALELQGLIELIQAPPEVEIGRAHV